MFFKVLAAMVTADAFDRRMREQQRRAWLAQDELRRQRHCSARDRSGLGADRATARRLGFTQRPSAPRSSSRWFDASAAPGHRPGARVRWLRAHDAASDLRRGDLPLGASFLAGGSL